MTHKDTIKEVMGKTTSVLEACLRYCREQNGLDHCKNCGLDQEMIDYIKNKFQETFEAGRKEGVKMAMNEIKKKIQQPISFGYQGLVNPDLGELERGIKTQNRIAEDILSSLTKLLYVEK